MMVCADGVVGALMRTDPMGGKAGLAGLAGLAGARETTVPSGKVIAGEPGRRVIGGPVGGVKTRDEADGLRVIGEVPIVAMTGLGAGATIGDGVGVWFELDDS